MLVAEDKKHCDTSKSATIMSFFTECILFLERVSLTNMMAIHMVLVSWALLDMNLPQSWLYSNILVVGCLAGSIVDFTNSKLLSYCPPPAAAVCLVALLQPLLPSLSRPTLQPRPLEMTFHE
ncbi:hypothetical protein CYMTET_37101 [Cymbomonas tetramitiformis]|uniref:Uncharacterized protein n=1 Tax=Cymbomonas tetramitiformis TaxID=36881 RepID=A0AAE0CGE5_9CHLO|nr:hypothetical protein CYMTET_37101 [Cymbomonas tetramitiformis]